MAKNTTSKRPDVYAMVTDRIIAELQKGNIPWQKPWFGSPAIYKKNAAISGSTGKPYSFLNQLMLGKPGEWYTFKQATDRGGKVRKGEKASIVVFWSMHQKTELETDPQTGETVLAVKPFYILKYYNVFHISQIDNLEPRFKEEDIPTGAEPDEEAEACVSGYLNRSGVKLVHEYGDRAFYRPSTDTVTVPERRQFKETAEYYSTVFHELTHSTGHEKRLARIASTAFFGNEEYSKEELVAELGASALVNYFGMETTGSFKNSAAYIQSWIKALQNDKRMIVSASSKAEKAVELILG